jgi:17beta-estradiol 17-dehydrogenase / very-long-chain 3-oxoacyl-CoA reductase
MSDIIYGVGLATIVYLTVQFLRGLAGTFLSSAPDLTKYGKWAIVTGATDGIGRAYADELARRKMNVVLISRTQSKLEAAAKEIEEAHNVETRVVAIDFSSFGKEKRAKVADAIKDLDIGVLVNNVGMSYSHPMFFHELSDDDVEAMLEMNISSTCWMTRAVLPKMKENKRGCIVNISSGAARLKNPLLALYSGTKSFVEKFSESLDAEYHSDGIHIQCQSPLFVTSKLSKIKKTSLSTPDPKGYVKAAVAQIGGPSTCSPFWAHEIQLWLFPRLPEMLLTPFVKNMHMGLRKRALKKAEAKKSQ